MVGTSSRTWIVRGGVAALAAAVLGGLLGSFGWFGFLGTRGLEGEPGRPSAPEPIPAATGAPPSSGAPHREDDGRPGPAAVREVSAETSLADPAGADPSPRGRGHVQVRGTIVDADDAAVEGARVVLTVGLDALETSTGADGTFRLFPPTTGRAVLRASHARGRLAPRSVSLLGGPGVVDLGPLVLGEARSIEGVVTRRQDGSAIAGAEVLLRQVEPWVLRNASSFDAVRAADAVAHTDPAGRFRLDGAGFGQAGIRVRATGSRDAWVEFVVGERPAPLSVVLEEAPPAARGRVVDRFGNPVAGARVQNVLDRTTSDGAGRFTLGGVDDPTGARATHPLHGVGHASWPADGEGEIVLPGSGAVLAVAVRDDGRPPVEPLAVEVELLGLRSDGSSAEPFVLGPPIEPAGDARRRIAGLWLGQEFRITVCDAEGAQGSIRHAVPSQVTDAPAVATVRLAAPMTIRGRVLDPERRPLAGADVVVGEQREGRFDPLRVEAVRTDSTGAFVFAARPRVSHLVFASLDGWVPVSVPLPPPRQGAAAIDVELEEGARLELRFDEASFGAGRRPLVRVLTERVGVERTPDADGVARFEALAPGPASVLVDLASLWPALAGRDGTTIDRSVELIPGETTQVDMTGVAGPAARFDVRLLDPSGRPVPGVPVALVPVGRDEREPLADATSDARGEAALFVSRPGSYMLSVGGAGDLAHATVDLAAGEHRTFEQRLAGGPVEVRVVDEEGDAVAGARVELFPARPGGARTTDGLLLTDSSGRVRFGFVPEGRFVADVAREGAAAGETFDVASGTITSVIVRLRSDG